MLSYHLHRGLPSDVFCRRLRIYCSVATYTNCLILLHFIMLLSRIIILFSTLYNVSTSSCAHLTIILSSLSFQSSSINPLFPISLLIPSTQVRLRLGRFRLPGGLHFKASFDKLWSERENQQDATVRCLFSTISQHVSGIIMPIFRRTRRTLLHVLCCAGSAGCGW